MATSGFTEKREIREAALSSFVAGIPRSPYELEVVLNERTARRTARRSLPLVLALALCASILLSAFGNFSKRAVVHRPSFEHLGAHCANIPPITEAEFHERQGALARVLRRTGAAAYIAEPGANAQFFGNISASKWHLSERPLLLVITATENGDEGQTAANVSVLTPTFEKTRAKLLTVPAKRDVGYVDWPEDANPYEVLASKIIGNRTGDIYVDSSMRKFISDGLASALPGNRVISAPSEVQSLREQKSPAEIDILRCANEVTLMAIREVRKHTRIGMYESEVRDLLTSALSSAGLQGGYGLVLFGENAALPHGSGTNRQLEREDFVLIDCGGTLHDYNSDITRTFAVRGSTILPDHLEIWFKVHAAQAAALAAASNGTITRSVDAVARGVLSLAGYGDYFTHRLGHGLGLEVHEAPYLRGGSDDVIKPGHVFSDEPGVYIEGKVGVRLEDAFFVTDQGSAEYLTASVGGQAKSPWMP